MLLLVLLLTKSCMIEFPLRKLYMYFAFVALALLLVFYFIFKQRETISKYFNILL